MKKLAIITLTALMLTPAGANAGGWDDFTCVLFNVNCDRSDNHDQPWWDIVGDAFRAL